MLIKIIISKDQYITGVRLNTLNIEKDLENLGLNIYPDTHMTTKIQLYLNFPNLVKMVFMYLL